MKAGAVGVYLLVIAVCTGIGGVAGWHLAVRKAPAAAEAGQAEADPHEGHDHGDGDEEIVTLTEAAAANAGLEVGTPELRDFVVSQRVPARIVLPTQAERPLAAPVAGRVEVVNVVEGQLVQAGEVVVRIVRDPLPRPSLALTEDLLKPTSEGFHETVVELHGAIAQLALAERELARLRTLRAKTVAGVPVISEQQVIPQESAVEYAKQIVEGRRHELELHGLSDEEVDALEAGKHPDLNLRLWRSVLQRHGIWTPLSERLLGLLPEAMRPRPWVVATVGELTAQDLIDDELLAWFAEDSQASSNFLEVAGLLQAGSTVASVRQLSEMGGLAATVLVRAPKMMADWDVERVLVRGGERVVAGEPLLHLSNYGEVYLEVHPVGSELVTLAGTMGRKGLLEAQPLVAGAGPKLADLQLLRILGDEADHPAYQFATANPVAGVVARDGRKFRSWSLRAGQRYMLAVPEKTLPNVLVVPATALVGNGPERIVYRAGGGGFMAMPVRVLHETHELAALMPGGDLSEKTWLVKRGAFQLHLAAQAGDGAADAHAGHGHAH